MQNLNHKDGQDTQKYLEKIKKEFGKEWRKDIDEIRVELFEQRKLEDSVKSHAFAKDNSG